MLRIASLSLSELASVFPVAHTALAHLEEQTTAGRVARWLVAGMNGPTVMTRVDIRHLLRAAIAVHQGADVLLGLQSGFTPVADAWWQEVYEDSRGRGGLCLRLADGHLQFQRVDLYPDGRFEGQNTFLVRSQRGYDPAAFARFGARLRDAQWSTTPRGLRLLRNWTLEHISIIRYDGSMAEGPLSPERQTEATRLLEASSLMAMVDAEVADVLFAAKFEEA